jgi:hypothetical protein
MKQKPNQPRVLAHVVEATALGLLLGACFAPFPYSLVMALASAAILALRLRARLKSRWEGGLPFGTGTQAPLPRPVSLRPDMAEASPGHELMKRWSSGLGHRPLISLPGVAQGFNGEMQERMLAAFRKIESLPELKREMRTNRPDKPDAHSGLVRRRPIKEVSEVGKLSAADLRLRSSHPTLFRYKLATNKFVIREHVSPRRKRGAFLLSDGSSSTRENGKHERICGTVLSQVQRVVNEDFEVWVSVCDTELGEVKHASTRREAEQVMLEFATHHHTGGGTNMPNSIRGAYAYVQKLLKTRPDLDELDFWLLSDTDAFGEISADEVPGTRVFSFVFGGANKPMCDFARSTGGLAFEDL